MTLLSTFFCVLLIHYGRRGRRNRIALFSPVALVGWFGLVYLIIPGIALEFGLHTKWALFVNENELFGRAHVPFILFALSGLLANTLLRQGRQRPMQPVVQIVRPRYPLVLLTAALGAFLLLLATGAMKLTDAGADGSGGGGIKFLLSFVDLGIPGLALLLFNGERNAGKLHLLMLLAVFVMYGLLGSRYRLVLIILLFLVLLLYRGYSLVGPRIVGISLTALVAIMFFSVGRTYRQGFDIDAALASDLFLLPAALLNESNVHLAMGAIIEYVPDHRPYDFWSPVLVALTSLVPRALWPDKPLPDYLLAIPAALRDPSLESAGAALPIYGEWYMMGGYVAVFVIGLLFLFLLQREFLRAIRVGRIGLAACITCFCAYSYTRGYLTQNLLAFVFVMLPAYFCYSRRVR